MSPRPSQQREWMVWRFCAWSGPLFILAFLAVWAGIAGWFPPPREGWGATHVMTYLHDHSVRIRLGMGLAMFVSGLYLFWTLAIARVMKRMEGTAASPITQLQTYGGLGTAIAIIIFGLLWVIAAFEVGERNPDPHTVQAFYDAGWIAFDLVGMPTMVQMSGLGAVLVGRRDPGQPQLMPRWVGYLGFYVALTFFEVLLLLYFKTGPFAWAGAVTYYLILVGFFAWMAVVSFYVIRATRLLEAEDRVALAQ